MQIEATYKNGRLELPPGLQLRRNGFKIRIDIPAEEIVKQKQQTINPVGDGNTETFSVGKQLNNILGSIRYRQSNETVTAQDYKEMWHSHLERKYLRDK